jgi:hypothetical protein
MMRHARRVDDAPRPARETRTGPERVTTLPSEPARADTNLMSAHTLSRSTQTVELVQVLEINERLRLAQEAGDLVLVTAERLGLTGAQVHLRVIDRAATAVIPVQERRRELPCLPASAALARLLAAGAPTAPYLYGVFAETGAGRRELPILLHTDHLRAISSALSLRRHLWGV